MKVLPIKNPFPRPMNDPLLKVAKSLEARFLSEMLKGAGLDAGRSTFGGGAGEDQFASFLRDAQAERIVAAGGIGLAEAIFRDLAATGGKIP